MPALLDYGKIGWYWLHNLAASLPDTVDEMKRQQLVSFMDNFASLFPCPVCGTHLSEYLKNTPIYPYTENRENVERYMYDLHEDVNKRKGKAREHTFEEVQDAFSNKKPWKRFGNYGIESSPLYLALNKNEIPKTTVETTSENSTLIWVFVVILIILFIVCVSLAIALNRVLVKRNRSQ